MIARSEHVAQRMGYALRSGWALPLAIAAVLSIAAAAGAQSTLPAGRFEDQPVRNSGDASAPVTARSAERLNQPAPIQFDWKRVGAALAIVVGLIFLLRLTGKKLLVSQGVSGAGRMIRVLGRATTGPRQQVVLLQIGKRIVVAADNAGQLATLCQITEADEVASLLGQLDESVSTAPKTVFSNWFHKATDDFGDEQVRQLAPAEAAVEDPSLETARGEIASLMDRARSLARQMRKK